MKKRILTVFIAVLSFIGMLSGISYATDVSEYIIFFNNADNTAITGFGNANEIYAKISLEEEETEALVVMIATYDNEERLLEVVNGFEKVNNEIKTNSVSTVGVKTVKVFALDGFLNMKPLLSKSIGIEADKMIGADNADKFTALSGLVVLPDEEKTVGDIFTGENVVSKYTDVTFESVSGTATAVFTEKSENWTEDTITFSGEGTVKVLIKDYYFCNTAEALVTVVAKQDRYSLVFENTDDYLYRVGNANPVNLSSLFAENSDVTAYDTPKVEVTNVAGDASGIFTKNDTTWTKGTIQFSGTGVVNVTVSDKFSKPLDLKLEVIDATNVTAYSGLANKNSVLLNDITMSSNSSYYLSNATLYGNGFTFDVTDGAFESSGYLSGNYLVSLTSANLDNVKIIGAVYTEYGATRDKPYNRAVVYSTGNNTIANSYISNCAAPVRVNDGTLEIVNSTLKGGNFANLDIRNGYVTLEDVTTINQVLSNDKAADGSTVIGFGIVFYESNKASLDVKGTLKQYNNITEEDEQYVNISSASTIFENIFACTNLIYTDTSGKNWVNSGIVSMAESVGDGQITDMEGYAEATPKLMGVTGYVHSEVPTEESIAKIASEYETGGQYAIAPTYSFDYTEKNYIQKTDGSNDYCYEENGTVWISMDEGDSFSWDTSILTVEKAGETLDYTVKMNNTDYTGESIIFDTAGDYEIIYTYTDSNNYRIGENGEVTTYEKTYTKTVHINVSVVKVAIKNAEITISPTSLTGVYTRTGWLFDYDYYYRMNFLNTVSIKDYDELGTASTVDLTSNISSATWLNTDGTTNFGAGTITITYTDGRMLTVKVGEWSGSGPSTKTCTVNTSNGVYLTTDGKTDNKNAVTWNILGYSYRGNSGAVVENNTTVTVTWTP